ncbi:hypothetical protein [Streptomyces sp. SLBN-31]|uniref:hypothetical protein n=1 Tax=Streptomyces sp. SLBN-31 TaxID=2768444 RepID=UPI001358569E|nr:hypothetical protein [Streptomyces sp. SLBN-31]
MTSCRAQRKTVSARPTPSWRRLRECRQYRVWIRAAEHVRPIDNDLRLLTCLGV